MAAVIKEVQAKSYSRAADAARVLADEKYAGMDRLVRRVTTTKFKP